MGRTGRVVGATALVLLAGAGVAGAASSEDSLGSTGGEVVVTGAEFRQVTEIFSVPATTDPVKVSATCSPGFVPISGGFKNPSMLKIENSFPDVSSSAWSVTFWPIYQASTVEVYAICADLD